MYVLEKSTLEHHLISYCLGADPYEYDGWGKSIRGVSVAFGHDKVEEFCKREDVDLIAR